MPLTVKRSPVLFGSVLGIVLVVSVLFGLSQCRQEQGNVFDLAVGQCFNDPEELEVVIDIDVVPCEEPHHYEVYAVVSLDSTTGYGFYTAGFPYPGDSIIDRIADAECLERFDAFVGLPYPYSILEISSWRPSRESWEVLHDRKIICVLLHLEGTLMEGSMEGSGI